MIGVLANPEQYSSVREFFELFKTPWELYRTGCEYDVLICSASASVPRSTANLTLVYAGQRVPFDDYEGFESTSQLNGNRMLLADGRRIPIYGNMLTFEADGFLLDEDSLRPAAYLTAHRDGHPVVRIGYDLFAEVAYLLSDGQPVANSSIPSIELHVSILRNLILDHGVSLVEIPPVPKGYQFIACLTHDVDHPSIRQHGFDHTMFGFVYRALVGSVFALLGGRASVRMLLANWIAVLKLPFVYFGVTRDFWNSLALYSELEGGARSTFFVIPFKGRAGQLGGHEAPSFRASGYGAADIAPQIRDLLANGNEIGLHGIDSWNDPSKAREELDELRRITLLQTVGVRMHWLYFEMDSPEILEKAGVAYDSTVGFNETIGYRAGTTQVYKPLNATTLLELPLHIMDTALFLSGRQNLSSGEAKNRVDAIIDNAVRFGGVVTVNWHDRSIVPERMWDEFYINLLSDLKTRGAWLASAGEAVRWFRMRRSATFDDVGRVAATSNAGEEYKGLPALSVQVQSVCRNSGQQDRDGVPR